MPNIPHDILRGWEIVLMDDEPDSLDLVQYILEHYGARVYTATNGKEGLELLQQTHPHFVISDLSMPGMDGWEFLRTLRTQTTQREIPVIALTAHAMSGDRERVLKAGFYAYLTKPINALTFMEQLMILLMDIPKLAEPLSARGL